MYIFIHVYECRSKHVAVRYNLRGIWILAIHLEAGLTCQVRGLGISGDSPVSDSRITAGRHCMSGVTDMWYYS